jgi:DNA polymerase-1
MSWQDSPEIYHPEVKLGAELEIYYPSWADAIKIPNKISLNDLISLMKENSL